MSLGQAIVEFGIAFIIVAFIMFFIVECALYYQAFYSVQTFNDEINSNLVLYDKDNICTSFDDEILDMLNSKAEKYFEQNMELSYSNSTDDTLLIQSKKEYLKNKILSIKITCNTAAAGISTKTNYLFKGPFLFRMGQILKSTSSVQGPKF